MKTNLSLICLLALLTGCVSTPTGTKPDLARIGRVAGVSAYIGAVYDMQHNPDHRPAYTLAVASLQSMVDTQNYDATALAASLQTIGVRELTGSDGSIIIHAALFVWDEILRTSSPVLEKEEVKAVLQPILNGLERALKATE
jgi:hypothetical protein